MSCQPPRRVRGASGAALAAAFLLVSCGTLPPNSSAVPASVATLSPSPTDAQTPMPSPIPGSPAPSPTPHGTPLPPGAVELVPILYLHRVVPIPADIGTWTSAAQKAFLTYVITPCEFAAQLDWLAAHGYTTILPRDLVAHWDQGVALPSRPVILTFDDGSADWAATVLPLLASHGMAAEFYVTTSRIGSYLTWADLIALRDAGDGIGAHDVHHVQLVGYVPQTVDAMRYEVTEAKRVLEANLGIPVDSMAYVGGGFDSALIDLVRAAGYRSARSIVRGALQSSDIRFHLHVSRIGVYDDVIGKTLANAMGCVLDPAMSDFQARVTGTNAG